MGPRVFAEKALQLLLLRTHLPPWQRVKQAVLLGGAEGLCAQLHTCYFVLSSSPPTTEDAGSPHPPVLQLSSDIINLFLICSGV